MVRYLPRFLVFPQAARMLECSRMAQSSPLRPVATVTPVTFYFSPSFGANFAVNFYDAAGAELAGGTIDLTVSFPTGSFSGLVSDPGELDPVVLAAQTPTIVGLAGGVSAPASFGADQIGAATITPSNVTPPALGTQYRILCTRPQAKRAPA